MEKVGFVTDPCGEIVAAARFPAFVNEPVVRWNAALTVVFVFVAAAAGAWVLPLLAADFAARTLVGPRYSPFARSGAWVMRRLGVRPKLIAGAPKRFAAGIGLSLVSVASLLVIAGFEAGWYAAYAVGVFAFLEAAFAFCAGCLMYNLLAKAGVVKACPTCVD